MTLTHYLIVSSILFVLGIFTVLSRRSILGILMGVELILNSCALNFVAFSHFNGNKIDGHIMALFIIILAAAETVVALALLLAIFKRSRSVESEGIRSLKE